MTNGHAGTVGAQASRLRKIRNEFLRIVISVAVVSFVMTGCTGVVTKSTTQTASALFQVSPTTISFGKVNVGKQARQTVTVANVGTVALNITQATVSNAQFSVSGASFPLALAAGQSSNLSVNVTPAAAANLSGILTVSGDGGSAPVTVSLSATAVSGTQPQLSVSPASVELGTVSTGTKGSANVTLSNLGSADLTISLISLTGAEFGISGITTPKAISAGQSVQATVGFSPTTSGSASGSLAITSNDPNHPTVTVPLSGTGSTAAVGQLAASPSSVSFGTVLAGSSNNKQITLTNSGNAAVKISSVVAAGTGFAVSGLTTPATLNASQNATLTVKFDPTTAGSATGSITVNSDASNSTLRIALSGAANTATGQLSASPASVSFGTVATGNSYFKQITLTNSGNAAVKIASVAVTGTGFSVSGLTTPATLNASQSATLTAKFDPTTGGGSHTGSVTVASDASNSTLAIALSGTATQPGLSVSPTSFNFGSVVDGQTKSQTFTLTNTGTATLTLAQITESGAGFSISGLSTPASLAAGQSTTFSVLFAPTTGGALSGSVSISSNAPNSPTTVGLSGSGVAGTVTMSATPSSLTFSSVNVGSSSAKTVTIANTGNMSLTVSQVSVSAKDFSVSGIATPLTLGAGQNATLNVSFKPLASEQVSGNVTVTTSQGASNVIPVSGTGIQTGLAITPSSVSFGNVPTGSSNSQTIQLSNSGTAALSISQVSVTGTGFSISTMALPLSLSPGQSSTFNVQFAPSASGSVTGSISVVSNAPGSPATIGLSGSGATSTQTLSFSSTNLGFGSLNVGMSSTKPIMVTNTGNANVTISGITVSGTGFSLSGAGTPVTLTPTQSLTFSVIFGPTAAGTDTGSVTVSSNASGSPVKIALSGSGLQATSHSVTLNWNASSSVSGYNVYRSTAGGTGYAKINGSLIGILSYLDSTVQSGTTYYYVTTAVDTSGVESTYSNEATAIIP
jgi:hypothetical protein